MLSAKKTSMEVNCTTPNNEEKFSVCVATIDDIPEIIRFIAAEQPYWLRFSSEHEFKTAIEIVPDSILIARDNDNAICEHWDVENLISSAWDLEDKRYSKKDFIAQQRKESAEELAVEGSVVCFPVDDMVIFSYALLRNSIRRLGFGRVVGIHLLKKFDGKKNAVTSAGDDMLPTYQKYGFKVQGHQAYWSGIIYKGKCNIDCVQDTSMITKMKQQDMANVVEYDKGLHPYGREWFVKECIFGSKNQLAYVARIDSQVVGYGYIKCSTQNNYSIVLFADDEKIARQLLSGLVKELPNGSMLSLVVPGLEENPSSGCLAEEMGLRKDSERAMIYMTHPINYQWRKTFFSELPFMTLT